MSLNDLFYLYKYLAQIIFSPSTGSEFFRISFEVRDVFDEAIIPKTYNFIKRETLSIS